MYHFCNKRCIIVGSGGLGYFMITMPTLCRCFILPCLVNSQQMSSIGGKMSIGQQWVGKVRFIPAANELDGRWAVESVPLAA